MTVEHKALNLPIARGMTEKDLYEKPGIVRHLLPGWDGIPMSLQ